MYIVIPASEPESNIKGIRFHEYWMPQRSEQAICKIVALHQVRHDR